MLGTIVRVRKTQKRSRHEQRTHQPSHRSRFERLTPESPRLCRGIFTWDGECLSSERHIGTSATACGLGQVRSECVLCSIRYSPLNAPLQLPSLLQRWVGA